MTTKTTSKKRVTTKRATKKTTGKKEFGYDATFYKIKEVFETYAKKYLYIGSSGLKMEDRSNWCLGYFFCDGGVNDAFKSFYAGAMLGRTLE